MKKIACVSDLHGVFSALAPLRQYLNDVDEIIVLGDVGIGFNHRQDTMLLNYLKSITNSPKIRLMRGNHDNKDKMELDFSEFYIQDGTVENGILFLGGANSPEFDRRSRIPGYDWWHNEGLSYNIIEELKDKDLSGVHTILAHDCPAMWYRKMDIYDTNLGETAKVLEYIAKNMVPNLTKYVHGHHHKNKVHYSGNITIRSLGKADDMYSGLKNKETLIERIEC